MSMGNVDFENLNLGNLGGLSDQDIANLFAGNQPSAPVVPPAESLIPIPQTIDISNEQLSALLPSEPFEQVVAPVAEIPLTPVVEPSTPTEPTPAEPVLSPGSTAGDTANQDALEIIKQTLKYYGLSDNDFLNEVASQWQAKRITPEMDIDQIGVMLADTEAFKKRFPANEVFKAAGKPRFSVSQYLRLESDFARILRSNGMPEGFYDSPSDFQSLIASEVSPDELADRINLGYQAVKQADPQVVEQFTRLYGIKEGDLAAYFIDPTRARPTFDRYEAQRQAQAARVAAQAQTQAQMALNAQQAEALVRAGIGEEGARAGFQAIGEQQQLFAGLMPGEEQITAEEQISGTFGTNAQARQAIARRRRSRQAAFETGGGFAGQGAGAVTGLQTVGK